MITFSGVRSSCDMEATKSALTRLARSSSSTNRAFSKPERGELREPLRDAPLRRRARLGAAAEEGLVHADQLAAAAQRHGQQARRFVRLLERIVAERGPAQVDLDHVGSVQTVLVDLLLGHAHDAAALPSSAVLPKPATTAYSALAVEQIGAADVAPDLLDGQPAQAIEQHRAIELEIGSRPACQRGRYRAFLALRRQRSRRPRWPHRVADRCSRAAAPAAHETASRRS
jgi:hypothetical protein